MLPRFGWVGLRRRWRQTMLGRHRPWRAWRKSDADDSLGRFSGSSGWFCADTGDSLGCFEGSSGWVCADAGDSLGCLEGSSGSVLRRHWRRWWPCANPPKVRLGGVCAETNGWMPQWFVCVGLRRHWRPADASKVRLGGFAPTLATALMLPAVAAWVCKSDTGEALDASKWWSRVGLRRRWRRLMLQWWPRFVWVDAFAPTTGDG